MNVLQTIKDMACPTRQRKGSYHDMYTSPDTTHLQGVVARNNNSPYTQIFQNEAATALFQKTIVN